MISLLNVKEENYTDGIGEYTLRLYRLYIIGEERYSLNLYKNGSLVKNITIEKLDISIPGLNYSTKYSLVLNTFNCFNEKSTKILDILQGKAEYKQFFYA